MSESVSDKHSQWSDSGPIIKRPRYALSECLKSCCSVKDIDINLIVNSISSNAFLMVTIVKWAKAHFLKHVRISFRAASHDDRARTVSNLKFIWVTIYAYSIFKKKKLFLAQAKCCPSNNQEQIFESTRWRTTQTLPKAQRTRGLSSYHKITVHSSQNLNISQFQNVD